MEAQIDPKLLCGRDIAGRVSGEPPPTALEKHVMDRGRSVRLDHRSEVSVTGGVLRAWLEPPRPDCFEHRRRLERRTSEHRHIAEASEVHQPLSVGILRIDIGRNRHHQRPGSIEEALDLEPRLSSSRGLLKRQIGSAPMAKLPRRMQVRAPRRCPKPPHACDRLITHRMSLRHLQSFRWRRLLWSRPGLRSGGRTSRRRRSRRWRCCSARAGDSGFGPRRRRRSVPDWGS